MPNGASQRAARVVGGYGQTIQRRREGRSQRLVRLRVFEGMDEREVGGDLGMRGWLEEDVRFGGWRLRVVRVGQLIERALGDGGGGRRGRSVQLLYEGAAERDDGRGRVYGYARELRDVLAAVGERAEVGYRRVGEEDERQCRDLPVDGNG